MTPNTSVEPVTVPVALGDRSYDVCVGVGLLSSAAERLARLVQRDRALIVTDETVAGLHLAELERSLAAQNIKGLPIVSPQGETAKSWLNLERLVEKLLSLDIERSEPIVALGGGVVGDLAGFAAAIIKRGTPFVQLPTTLLAQVDSSVGGKTAINTRAGKNLVGAFHQPSLVLADIGVLHTLPDRERRAGLAEIIKIAVMRDGEFFAWLEANADCLLAGDTVATQTAVARAVALKAEIVAADERESGVRALLNFGHTFGHAFEAEAAAGAGLSHGYAVAAGMAMASEFAARHYGYSRRDHTRLIALLEQMKLPVGPAELNGAPFQPRGILARMANDKKVAQGQLRLVLPQAIGHGALVALDHTDDLELFLEDWLSPRATMAADAPREHG